MSALSDIEWLEEKFFENQGVVENEYTGAGYSQAEQKADREKAARLFDRLKSEAIPPLLSPVSAIPAGCHCGTTCMAPVIMGRQQPCRRTGGVPGLPAPKP